VIISKTMRLYCVLALPGYLPMRTVTWCRMRFCSRLTQNRTNSALAAQIDVMSNLNSRLSLLITAKLSTLRKKDGTSMSKERTAYHQMAPLCS
jgi:hypothetical protein